MKDCIAFAIICAALTFCSEQTLAQELPCDHTGCAGGVCSHVPIDVEYGKRRPFIDGVGWVLGVPEKLLYWNRKALNHDVSRGTVHEVANYLQYRDLQDVKLRVNQYDPIGEWDRLVENKRISPGWKYSVGLVRHVGYIVMPGRLVGTDNYNPFTNTVSLYSDMPSLGLAESAYAYDVHQQSLPGTYAVTQSLPLVSMWHETRATNEVQSYVALRGTRKQQEQSRQNLYARYGISLGNELSRVLPDGGGVFRVIGAVAGHTSAAIERNYAIR